MYRVSTVGLNALELVMVGTVMELTIFVFEIPTGVVADVVSRRLSVVIGYALMGLAFLIEGYFPFLPAVLFAAALWGFGWTFISGAREAWIADEVGAEAAGPVYLRGTQAIQIGSLVGIPLSVALGWNQLNLPFLVGGAILLLLSAALVLVMPEIGFKRRPVERGSLSGTLREGFSLIRSRRALSILVIIGLFIGLYSEGYDRLREAYLIRDITLPALGGLSFVVWFGVLRMGSRLLTLGSTELAKRRLRRGADARLLRWLQWIYGSIVLALLAFAFAPGFGVALLASWAIDTLRATADPIQTAWVNLHIESKVRATVLSTYGQVDALGEILAGPVVGVIGLARSIQAALVTSALLLFPVVPLFGRAGKSLAQDAQREARQA